MLQKMSTFLDSLFSNKMIRLSRSGTPTRIRLTLLLTTSSLTTPPTRCQELRTRKLIKNSMREPTITLLLMVTSQSPSIGLRRTLFLQLMSCSSALLDGLLPQLVPLNLAMPSTLVPILSDFPHSNVLTVPEKWVRTGTTAMVVTLMIACSMAKSIH